MSFQNLFSPTSREESPGLILAECCGTIGLPVTKNPNLSERLSQTPNPPTIPEFYTLTKIHKPTLVGRPIISGCDGPTERISSFVDRLIQPIAQQQESYPKDSTDFINFIEKTKLPKNAILASMDVTSLYTNIPQEEGGSLLYAKRTKTSIKTIYQSLLSS